MPECPHNAVFESIVSTLLIQTTRYNNTPNKLCLKQIKQIRKLSHDT
jgi:hypothetical protein